MAEPPTIPVRHIRFEYPDDVDPAWIPGRPEFACAANSISLLMPFMEPYFVRSVAAALPDLRGPLKERTRAYLGQETQHHRQHLVYNQALTGRYPALSTVEQLADRVYGWLGRSRSPAFNLAFASVSETIAYSAARWCERRRNDLFVDADPVISRLFFWHLAEEVEHKAVAFEVEQSWGVGRLRRLGAMITSMLLVLFFVGTGTTVMLAAERRLFNPLAWIRLTSWAVTFAFEAISNLVVSMLPGFHPDQFADPLWYEVWLRELDQAEAGESPPLTDR